MLSASRRWFNYSPFTFAFILFSLIFKKILLSSIVSKQFKKNRIIMSHQIFNIYFPYFYMQSNYRSSVIVYIFNRLCKVSLILCYRKTAGFSGSKCFLSESMTSEQNDLLYSLLFFVSVKLINFTFPMNSCI